MPQDIAKCSLWKQNCSWWRTSILDQPDYLLGWFTKLIDLITSTDTDLDFSRTLHNISQVILMDKTEKCGLNNITIRRLHIYLTVGSKGFD